MMPALKVGFTETSHRMSLLLSTRFSRGEEEEDRERGGGTRRGDLILKSKKQFGELAA